MPTITWHYEQVIEDPETAEEIMLTHNYDKDNVYVFGSIHATFSTDLNKLRLDCSDGITAQYLCFAGESGAEMSAQCGRMKFKITCTKQ